MHIVAAFDSSPASRRTQKKKTEKQTNSKLFSFLGQRVYINNIRDTNYTLP
jgi:hypothetical protein